MADALPIPARLGLPEQAKEGDDRNRTGVDGFAEGRGGELSAAERQNRP
jgi:hypothetical protein